MTNHDGTMTRLPGLAGVSDDDLEEPVDRVEFDFDLDFASDRSRRDFLRILAVAVAAAVPGGAP